MSLFFLNLKQQLKYILLFLLFSITFAITFFFYNFPLEALTYPTLLCVCFGLFFFIWDFSKTKALHTRLMELSNLTELSVDMIRALPQSDSIENTDYQLLLSGLAEQILELKTAQSTRLTDMIDYYTVWVHQIKTPISSMRLTLQNEDSLLARKLSCDLSHIEQYVEMVLAFLRLDSNSSDYVFKMHELDPLLRQSIRRFSSEFINRKLILSYTPPSDESGTLKMITDDKWFCFVIEQLLSNALKYTRAGTISIFFSQPKVLCLKDTGIGIAPQDLPRIFEKGYTGCNGRTDKKASGLGLYLCKRICKNLGIGISITSEVDNGTCVYLSLDQYPLKAE